ncbi:Uronyl 2-sulfotransferase [Lamellibrachia satsuma]|nr:Uronyl 2-sulfotransferase [Lamellibrachia satsuma]
MSVFPRTRFVFAIFVFTQLFVIVMYYTRTVPDVCECKKLSPSADSDAVSRDVSSAWSRGVGHSPSNIFYNRVPKCGSRTMLTIVQTLSDFNNFTYIHSKTFLDIIINETEQGELCAEVNDLRVPKFYDRHVHFVDFTRFNMEMPVYINIIRDPFERLVSWYHFRRFQSTAVSPLPDADQNRSYDECVLGNHSECSTPQGECGYFRIIPFFCGQDAFCRIPSQKALDMAIANVERYYGPIGVLEQFEQFIETLEIKFPDFFKGASHVYKELGKSKKKNVTLRKLIPTEKVRQIMLEKLELEYKFYFYVRRRFDKMYHEINTEEFRHAQNKTYV